VGGRTTDDREARGIPTVVSDSSPLIALERIGRLDLLRGVFERLLVPPAVAQEVGGPLPSWIVEHDLARPLDQRVAAARLDPGEREAIALSLERGAQLVVLDDLRARRLAHGLGLTVIGTVGVLVSAKRLSLLPDVRPVLTALRGAGFRLGPELIGRALRDAGEAP
jgi:predicted nucleic acid-binding protein